ncbi:hypothetical protein [Mucilaginibacter dorajii]|uniref:Membrane transporter protein n=1 Tax=Mucilaginibacter dorajii TaxID=692994 RepID=A0ABP7PQ20_9SPHI|nr:hypothetical protein [Mucilaginibacter dorajii]MCS3736934.1 hypothetical protein [Mucilaginibacter dorajii]
MNWTKVNIVAFKIVAGTVFLYLVLGGVAMCLHTLYLKGLIGIVAGSIVGVLFVRKPSVFNWVQVFTLLFVAMYIVGFVK